MLLPRACRTNRASAKRIVSCKVFLGGFQRVFFARGGNLNNWGGCAHQMQ